MPTIFLDTETYSPIDLKKCGMHKYFSHPDSETMIIAYQTAKNEPVIVIDLVTMSPKDALELEKLKRLLMQDDVKIATHNAEFDRLALQAYPVNLVFPASKFICTQSIALSHGYPGALSQLCDALNIAIDKRKLGIGSRLIHIFCVPKQKGDEPPVRVYAQDKPKEWSEFLEYAKYDIISMRECMEKIKIVNYPVLPFEQNIYKLTSDCNSIGVRIDEDFCKKISWEVDQYKKGIKSNDKPNQTQTAKYLEYLNSTYGIDPPLENLQKPTIEKLLTDESIPEALIDDLESRMEAASTSVSKYDVLLRCADGGKIHGLIQYHGAMRTGRDAGRLFQPQNLPRPKQKYLTIKRNIEATKLGCLAVIEDDIMQFAVSAVRSAIIASPGKKLVIADLSNIEGRVTSWFSGLEWKLKDFADYDNGLKDDMYITSYSVTFGIPADKVTDDQRQIGKVMELMLGYEGGVGAFLTGAKTYRIDLDNLASIIWPKIPETDKEYLSRVWERAKGENKTFDLKKETYISCDYIKSRWRAKHERLRELWAGCKGAFRYVCENPGKSFILPGAGHNAPTLKFSSIQAYANNLTVHITLPSGRKLCYPYVQYNPRTGELSYMGKAPFTGKWMRLKTYGGKLVENIVQAASRDIFKIGQLRAWEKGYYTLFPVHDELVTETENSSRFTSEGLCDIMTASIPWAKGLPLAAKGFESDRYRKG